MSRFLSCLQHSRPCCIGYTNSRLRLEFVYPIQHGRSCCKHYLNMKNSLLTGLVFSYTEVTCSLVLNSVALLYLRTPVSVFIDVKYTLDFSPSFLLLYSLKTAVRLPILAILKRTMTLPFGKPTSIQNRQQDAESRKILFACVNRFDQPIKTWDKTFLKLF